MTAAYRLKGAGWLIACVAIVLGFYLVSLRVAAERKKLDRMDAQIAAAERDIRALETEFDTRANLAQLERWNGDTLSLAAPVAAQFVRSGSDLAALDVSAAPVSPAGHAGVIRAAALVVPAAVTVAPVLAVATPTPAAVVPTVVAAVHSTATVAAVPAPVVKSVASPATFRVAAVRTAPSAAGLRRIARLASAERAQQAVALVRPRAVAMLDSKLLSDATLGSLLSGARHEARLR